MRIPFSAPFPVPTIMAVGVASPSAHGQAITRTEIKIVRANLKSPVPINHAIPEATAMAMTAGTKYPATMSASFAIGALEPCACSTSFMI